MWAPVHPPLLFAAEFLPIDLTQLVGISMSMLLVLIPVIGATVRFAGKPFVEALLKLGVGHVFEPRGAMDPGTANEVARLSRRVLELEQEVDKLKGLSARQIVAVADVVGDGLAEHPELKRVR